MPCANGLGCRPNLRPDAGDPRPVHARIVVHPKTRQAGGFGFPRPVPAAIIGLDCGTSMAPQQNGRLQVREAGAFSA